MRQVSAMSRKEKFPMTRFTPVLTTRMTKNPSWWAISVVLALTLCTSLYAQRGRWTYLGNSHVDGANDHDSIKVGRSEGGFRAIQLRISGGAINFERVIVRYGNGTQEEIPVRARIPDGGQTRVIDLPGERRLIESVDLWYGKDKWTKRPKVSLFGLR
jgi:hypothetical protein